MNRCPLSVSLQDQFKAQFYAVTRKWKHQGRFSNVRVHINTFRLHFTANFQFWKGCLGCFHMIFFLKKHSDLNARDCKYAIKPSLREHIFSSLAFSKVTVRTVQGDFSLYHLNILCRSLSQNRLKSCSGYKVWGWTLFQRVASAAGCKSRTLSPWHHHIRYREKKEKANAAHF